MNIFINNSKINFFILILPILFSGCFHTPKPDEDPNRYRVTNVYYQPFTGSNVDIDWVNPGNNLNYSNVKIYTPIVQLENPAPRNLSFNINVWESRSVFSDYLLGSFSAYINQGSQSVTSVNTPNFNTSANVVPVGAPAYETRGFWLGCTKKGKVRGNEGRGDNSQADVYLTIEWATATHTGQLKSNSRSIRCVN